MLINTINTARELRQEFISYDRDKYTYEAYQAIIEYFNEFDNIELDVIAICCDFNESSVDDIISDYSIYIENEDSKLDELMDYLGSATYAVETANNKILYISF